MRDGEWTLAAGSEAYTFGPADLDVYLQGPPDLGDYEISVEDAASPVGDGVFMGADYFGGRTITFDLAISQKTEAEALDAQAALLRAWRGDALRRTPGATATLTARRAGRERVTYGRPRKIAPNLDKVGDGFVTLAATFATTTALWYSPTVESTSVTLVPAATGGFEAPFVFPLTSSESSDRSTSFTVSGTDLPVYPVVEITGPVTSPAVEVVGLWRLEFPGLSLAWDQTLRVDTRPWVRTITRDGASVAGATSRSSVRLADAEIPSGTHEFVLSGTSETGTATARLSWQNTYLSL